MIRMTLNCLVLYRSYTAMLVWSVFSLILPKCVFAIIIIHSNFIYISQGSVEMDLWCGGINNNCIIANCPQSVSVKIMKISQQLAKMDKSKVPRFLLAYPVHTDIHTLWSIKNTPKFIDNNLKVDYRTLIIFGTTIADTTCHQTIIYVST